jgi:hypothetical protein
MVTKIENGKQKHTTNYNARLKSPHEENNPSPRQPA